MLKRTKRASILLDKSDPSQAGEFMGLLANKPAIILVEDDPDLLDVCGELLRGAFPEHTVCSSENGRIGLNQINQKAPHIALVLTDFNMDGLNGGEMLAEMDKRPELSLVPRIMMSGIGEEDYRIIEKQGGTSFGRYDHWLLKPVPAVKLLETIERILKLREPKAC